MNGGIIDSPPKRCM